jgi:CHAT domain-containing protein
MGEIYTSQGDYKKGLELYQQSLAIIKKANDQNENLCIIQAAIGESYFYLNNFSESDKWLKESLKTCELVGAIRPKTDALAVLGRLKIEEKKYEEAFVYLSEGAKISREKNMKISYVFNLSLLGQLEVERKNYAKAKPILEESIKTSREMGKNATLWESLYWLGILYKENNQLPQSSQYLKESISIIEKIRNSISGGEEAKKMFSSDKNILKVYEALVDVLLKQGETDLAMSYIQKNNEDNLKAKFKGLDVKFENADKNKVIAQERDMKAKLDGIEQQIANERALPVEKQNTEKLTRLEGIKTVAEGDYLKFVNQQVNVRPELSKYFNNSVQPAQLKGKKKQIPTDMALLSYLPGESQLYIFVATNDTVVAKVVNVTRAQLTRNINGSLNLIRTKQGAFGNVELKNEASERNELVFETNQTDELLKPFEELYQYLIAPASEIISNKKRLCIIPNGVLSYIPFQLLGKTLKNGKFSLLMNQYAVFYANSTDMLLRVTEQEKGQLNILAFGNPDNTLPSTEKEVREIKTLFPTASVFLRDDATEDKAKYAGEEYNVIHFATHGNLDYEDFAKSFLTMASNPAKHEDGMLTLEELWGMDVMSHLNIVVLSACQTAVSRGSDESSPVSPASGFLQNGVKSVVATLWKVDDEATSLLMTDFYRNIKTMDAVDALRVAQVNLSHNPNYAHPFYWAAAVLLGDWR